jgi:hypothetical protein
MVRGDPLLRGEVAEHRRLLAVSPSHAAPPLLGASFEAHHTRSGLIGKRERASFSASC